MKLNFAKRMSYIKASEIREILKVTEQEDVISFAGGLPAPELFPIDEINEINQIVLKEAGTKALQYTTTEGYAPFARMDCQPDERTFGHRLSIKIIF